MSQIIQTEDLTVRYGVREAISSLSATIPSGTVGLLGPNGAGKSTLLKTLLGFLTPTRGKAVVLGYSTAGSPLAIRLRVGYFPERHVFIPDLNAVDSVALAGELGGLSRTMALERAHEVLRFAGLGEARYRPTEGYSTGMLQRTKLAMALVHDPELVFLDEPTSGLDPTGRRQMLELVQQLSRRHGISVLLSTHLLHDVESVCDSVVLLKKGTLVLQGALDTLKRKPRGLYELRVRERLPGRFANALEAAGVPVEEDLDGLLHVTLEEAGTTFLFETARKTGAELRHMERFEPSLEEVFLDAIGRES
jgi:ABC-2 type transport system ATP-binding protein